MRKVKEVLRLRFELGLGQRQIAPSCGMGLGTVHEYLERAVAAEIGWRSSTGAPHRDARRIHAQETQSATGREEGMNQSGIR